VTGYSSHCFEHFGIVDLVVLVKPLDHSLPRDGVILLTFVCGLLTGCLHEASIYFRDYENRAQDFCSNSGSRK
jgi:hypothetical protein